MIPFKPSRLFVHCLMAVIIFSVAGQVQAGTVQSFADEALVSRGDFVRAVVKALDLEDRATSSEALPYIRVPKALEPYVRVVHEQGALEVFGDDLLLGRSITRGQAAKIVAGLMQLESAAGDTSFRDVKSNSPFKDAVIFIQDMGLAPLSNDFFGVNRALLGKDAVKMITALGGEVKTHSFTRSARPDRPLRPVRTPTKTPVASMPTITIDASALGKVGTRVPKVEILEAVWDLVNDMFLYDDRIDPNEVAYKMAEAMLGSLDDSYTSFMRPVNAKNFQTQLGSKISGIGAQVEYKDGELTIVTPLPGSPAIAAGLEPGDVILKADGVELTGIGFLEAVEHVRGAKGSTVLLNIRRNGSVIEVSVVRDDITIPEIDISWQNRTAVVRLMQFGKLTENDLRNRLAEVNAQDPKALILDLRNNPGGLLEAAAKVLSNFLPKGNTVAHIISRNSERTVVTKEESTIDSDVKIIVLVNKGSASASEIVAGALQDYDRAIILGETTFGKGSVQQVVQFNDGSGMKMTVSKWLTPNKHEIDGKGVTPDVPQEQGERDDQMTRALELSR